MTDNVMNRYQIDINNNYWRLPGIPGGCGLMGGLQRISKTRNRSDRGNGRSRGVTHGSTHKLKTIYRLPDQMQAGFLKKTI
jgi:hypothetical protein